MRVPRVRHWRRARVPRRWRHGIALDPRKRRPKGVPSLWTRARRLLWSWLPWFVVALAAAVTDRWGWAAGAGLMAFLSYLLAPTEHAPQYGLDHEFSADSEEFQRTLTGATGVQFAPGNRLDVLQNGDAFYPAMLDAIGGAQASITIEAYIYWNGAVGLEFARALAAKAREGLPVKILLDAVGSATIGTDILELLQDGGCQLAWFNAIHWYTLGRFNRRTHRKSLIVDGRVGFTGGAGIADQWLGNAESPEHWRDTQLRLEGPAVTPLQTGFAQNWLQTTGELVSGAAFYPDHPPAGPLAVQTIMSSPETGASSVRIMYYLAIVSARESVLIANPYFIPDQAAIDTLVDAKRRGVDVKVMVSGRHNDNWLARQNSVRLYGPLLRAGVEIYEFNHTMLHQKTMVVDGRWLTIGTTNFDHRSFSHNEENSVCVIDPALAAQLTAAFRADMEGCNRIDLSAWQHRRPLYKVSELIASFLEAQV